MVQKKYYINTIVINELENNKKLIDYYNELISKFVKGSLYVKIINKKKYCYLKYRENKKSILKYIGTEEIADNINRQIEQRKHYENIIKKLKEENEHIIRMVNVK